MPVIFLISMHLCVRISLYFLNMYQPRRYIYVTENSLSDYLEVIVWKIDRYLSQCFSVVMRHHDHDQYNKGKPLKRGCLQFKGLVLYHHGRKTSSVEVAECSKSRWQTGRKKAPALVLLLKP